MENNNLSLSSWLVEDIDLYIGNFLDKELEPIKTAIANNETPILTGALTACTQSCIYGGLCSCQSCQGCVVSCIECIGTGSCIGGSCQGCTVTCEKSCQSCEGKCTGCTSCQGCQRCQQECTEGCQGACQSCTGGGCQETCISCTSGSCQESCISCTSGGCQTSCTGCTGCTGCTSCTGCTGCTSCTGNCMSCQACESGCQGYCEKNKEYVHEALNLEYHGNYFLIDDGTWNGLLDYIDKAIKLCKYDYDIVSCKTARDEKATPKKFNDANTVINKFINANTGVAKKQAGDLVLKKEVQAFEDEMNKHAKVPTTLPCCENTKFEQCLNKQLCYQ